ncbi:MAG: tRNA uridine-5-carboxymethylaminomethyl(34) synthesis GTPase MnmE [Dethiobacteria bacterium]
MQNNLLNNEQDTICAISTPIGEGGISIVRLSGEKAWDIVMEIFYYKKQKKINSPRSHHLYYGIIKDGNTVLDEVLVSFMKAPHTYTRENMAEINCHGGIVPVRQVLELLLRKGARLAEPGEFTKRAFLNGRIDLIQAESVLNIVNAKTKKALTTAMQQLDGRLSAEIKKLRAETVEVLAEIEAVHDYPEDDLEEMDFEYASQRLQNIVIKLRKMIDGADQGRIIHEGLKTAIIGRPNVGKSSLLNALLRQQRAIVTDIPGTTRDLLEEYLNLKGIPLRIIDTAGIQDTEDIVEKHGIQRSKEVIRAADLILFVLDASEGITESDLVIFELIEEQPALLVLNKIDLGNNISKEELNKCFPGFDFQKTAVTKGLGLEELEAKIVEMVFKGKANTPDSNLVFNLRQKKRLEVAYAHFNAALNEVAKRTPLDLVAIDIREAWNALGELTGETLSEAVINKIFEQFCVGK